MYYCKKCQRAFSEAACPECGHKSDRSADPEDLCFLTEKQEMWAEMLDDVLKQNEIPFVKQDEQEAWVTVYIGSSFKVQKFYVPYAYLSRAKELVEELFAEQTNEEEVEIPVDEK